LSPCLLQSLDVRLGKEQVPPGANRLDVHARLEIAAQGPLADPEILGDLPGGEFRCEIEVE
jgi:hypothetical protein